MSWDGTWHEGDECQCDTCRRFRENEQALERAISKSQHLSEEELQALHYSAESPIPEMEQEFWKWREEMRLTTVPQVVEQLAHEAGDFLVAPWRWEVNEHNDSI